MARGSTTKNELFLDFLQQASVFGMRNLIFETFFAT